MRTTNVSLILAISYIGILAATPVLAETFVDLSRPDLRELQSSGFELSTRTEVSIDAVGVRGHNRDDMAVHSWIIDADTRQPIWRLDDVRTERHGDTRDLRHAEETIELDAGRYEVYQWAGNPWMWGNWGWSSGNVWHWSGHDDDWDDDDWDDDDWSERRRSRDDDEWGDEDDEWDERRERERESAAERRERERERSKRHRNESRRYWDDLLDECYVRLSTAGPSNGARTHDVVGDLDGALIKFNRLGDSAFESVGIKLDQPMSLRLYMLVEYVKGTAGPADFGWIVNADTRERVWHPRKSSTERAGGDRKNRVIDEEVAFEAGSYVLYYGTDDSHSYDEWNASPPWDPANWGVTVLPGEGFRAAGFSTYEPRGAGEPLIDLTRARDYDLLEQPFRLARGSDVFVLALGEYDWDGGDFVDYGWIADAKTGEPVWSMSRRNTMPAGGAEKNRMFDGKVALEAGDYIAYYVTDDSHSYEEWNSASPFQPDKWGMTVYPGTGMSRADFNELNSSDLAEDSNVLVKMVMVGDHERQRQRFTLDRAADVRVVAIGEGLDGRMYDYGYIMDDDTGDVVWEMTYRRTKHAGGAHKNRIYDRVVHLDAGSYKAVYVTDGSHSFEDWNDDRPREPWKWGMTVQIAD